MVVSHKYRYLYIELPHTASTAMSQELCNHYAGERILHKHAHYREFLAVATQEEKKYFTFASIRNPLDVTVTIYFKRKTNHQKFYSDPKNWKVNGGHVSKRALKEFRYINEHNAKFDEYLVKFYRIPYDSWGSPRPDDFDFVIRFENLQEDFSRLLQLLKIEQKRPLATMNKTGQKLADFWSYYTPDTYAHVKSVFGPYLQAWDYSLPLEWGATSIPSYNLLLFHFFAFIRKNFVWGSSIYANLFRSSRRNIVR